MPSFGDSIFLFVLALLLFGPKKLPVLARELGKWIGEFRRASNEFKMQMEEELRQVEQADRQKRIAAMEAAAPIAPPLETPEHPHLPETSLETIDISSATEAASSEPPATSEPTTSDTAEPAKPEPLPIATSGTLSIMPPATGLPTPRAKSEARPERSDPLGSLLDAIPSGSSADTETQPVAVGAEGETHAR